MKSVSDYMMLLHKEFQQKREVSDATASQYIRTLYSLNNNRPFTNLAWLKQKDAVAQRLSEFAESTQKTNLSVIVSALSLVKDKPTYKRIYAHYYSEMMDRSKASKEKDTSVKTEKQDANWLSWEVVEAHRGRLEEDVKKLPVADLSVGQWESVLAYGVLSLYTHFDPRRNQDYQFMYVVKSPKQATDQSKNYYVIDAKQFIFHKYKTARSHGEQVFDVPAPLVDALSLYLTRHPILHSKKFTAKTPAFPLLCSLDGSPLTAVNAITRILNRIFGRRVGSTMLRHIYLSSKYDVAEMNETADRMGHTGNVQREYLKAEKPAEGGSQAVTIPMLE
jgi:hypothetical protein